MSTTYYIVLDNQEPGFDTFVHGKAIAYARDSLYAITETLGLKGIDDLTSFGQLEADLDLPVDLRESETPWFKPKEGLKWIRAVRRYIKANPTSVGQSVRVLFELDKCEEVLEQAETIGAKWHFEMDI